MPERRLMVIFNTRSREYMVTEGPSIQTCVFSKHIDGYDGECFEYNSEHNPLITDWPRIYFYIETLFEELINHK